MSFLSGTGGFVPEELGHPCTTNDALAQECAGANHPAAFEFEDERHAAAPLPRVMDAPCELSSMPEKQGLTDFSGRHSRD
jgi:hypothetical protein